MSKKQPYLRDVSGWESRMRWASEKNVVDKKKQKKKILQVGRKRSIVADQNNNILRELILQKIEQNEHNYHTQYDRAIDKIRVNIIFSKSYTLTMTLPSTMRLSELQQLIGCYVKLHLKHRPTERHVYSGLESSMMRMEKLQLLEPSYRSLQEQSNTFQQQHESFCFFTTSVVKYITDSILLSDGYSQLGCKSLLQRSSQQTLSGTLMEMVVGHRLVRKMIVGNEQLGDEVSLLVRYDSYFTNSGDHVETTAPVQNSQLFTLDPDQHHETTKQQQQLSTVSPKHSLIRSPNCHYKQISFSSPHCQIMKWFAETNIVKWMVVYQHIIGDNNTCLSRNIQQQQQQQQQKNSFISAQMSQQSSFRRRNLQNYQLTVQTSIPIRLNHNHNTKSIYHLNIFDYHHSPQQKSQKMQQLTKCLIQSNLPLTHCVKEIYTVNKSKKQEENLQQGQQYKYQYSDCLIVVVLETIQLRTISLREYLRQLLNRLITIIKDCTNHNICTCQSIRYASNYHHYQYLSHQNQQQQTYYLQNQIKRILVTVKGLCQRISTVTTNSNNLFIQSIILHSGKFILDMFDIFIQPTTITQVLINSIAITNLICEYDVNSQILHKNGERRDRRRRDDKTRTSNMGIQTNKQEQNITMYISQRLIQQVLTILNSLHISTSNHQYFTKLFQQSLLSPSNTRTIYPTALTIYPSAQHQSSHHLDYLNLITNQIHRQSEKFLLQLSASSLQRGINGDPYTPTDSKKALSLEQKYDIYVQHSLHQLQQQLYSFMKFIHNNHSHLQIDCLYSKPHVNTFLQDQHIDIYEKQTTLKKKNKPFPSQQNSNTKSNHSPLQRRKQIKVISTSEFDSKPNSNKKSNNKNNISNNNNNNNNNKNINNKKKEKTKRPAATSTLRK